MASIIDFSAQFGGNDAADVVLPHFRALKAAAKGVCFEGFSLPELSFILRVDGEVNAYGLSGVGCLDFDKDNEYVSVDIGITLDDRRRLETQAKPEVITEAIISSTEFLKSAGDKRLDGTDFAMLKEVLLDLCARYVEEIAAV